MIGLILGTSEGREILSKLNKFTDDLCITTATSYGGELLKDYKYKVLNTEPLDMEKMCEFIRKNNMTVLVDASHPYALEVSKNAIEASRICNIKYLRYERPSVVDEFADNPNVYLVDSYSALKEYLLDTKGTILNTTGSRNIDKILELNLPNRIIHRVLPSLKVMQELFNFNIKVEDMIAIKGPISYDLNCAFINEYSAEAVLMKDSGSAGGTEEKIQSAVECGAKVFVIKRTKTIEYPMEFSSIDKLVSYIEKEVN